MIRAEHRPYEQTVPHQVSDMEVILSFNGGNRETVTVSARSASIALKRAITSRENGQHEIIKAEIS